MNRGSATAREPSGRTLSGFNEAPIHESGKSQACQATALHDVRLQ